jgi:predicted PurR-regulated permease PerM
MSEQIKNSGVETTRGGGGNYIQQSLEITIKIGLVLLLVLLCYLILKPFLLVLVWGLIIAVAIHPGFKKICKLVGARTKLASILTTLVLVLILIVPGIFLTDSLFTGVSVVKNYLTSNEVLVPPPEDSVKEWPLIGGSTYKIWNQASTNLSSFMAEYRPQLKSVGEWIISSAGRAGLGLLQFVFSIVIAGFFLANGESGRNYAKKVGDRLAGEKGLAMIHDAETTIRNVGKGIIGVALIQSVLAGAGFFAAGIPGAALWALMCLFLGVIQIGILPVVIPVVIFAFYSMSTTAATIFLIWMILISPLDNILKPIFLGRGAPVPMLVVFLGAIGGFISFGIIGLFLGAVLLSLGYQLFLLWLKN